MMQYLIKGHRIKTGSMVELDDLEEGEQGEEEEKAEVPAKGAFNIPLTSIPLPAIRIPIISSILGPFDIGAKGKGRSLETQKSNASMEVEKKKKPESLISKNLSDVTYIGKPNKNKIVDGWKNGNPWGVSFGRWRSIVTVCSLRDGLLQTVRRFHHLDRHLPPQIQIHKYE
jgi:hypothetical protein